MKPDDEMEGYADFITDLVVFGTIVVIGAATGAILWALFIR